MLVNLCIYDYADIVIRMNKKKISQTKYGRCQHSDRRLVLTIDRANINPPLMLLLLHEFWQIVIAQFFICILFMWDSDVQFPAVEPKFALSQVL